MKRITQVATLSLALLGAGHASATPVSFDVDFTSTRYVVDADDTFTDLVAAHDAGRFLSSTTVDGFEGVSTQLYSGVRRNYSVRMTANLNLKTAGDYTFQVGADWGRGGGVALIETESNNILDEYVIDDDIWWAYRWNNPDVITTRYSLDPGSYQVVWLGFEGCCAGSSTVRYSFDGAPFQALTTASIDPFLVPNPGVLALLVPAFGAIAMSRRRAKRA